MFSSPYASPENKETTIALAGQPNTGKSTVFNFLTGAKQHVGNWPGKTVEKKKGRFFYDGASYSLVDLPGTYSLSANSSEEVIARDFIIKQAPGLIVVVVDASQLSRSFYLVAEVINLGVPVIVALNMMDVAEKNGLKIDIDAFEKSLGFKVVPMTASKNIGISDLTEAIRDIAQTSDKPRKIHFNLDEKYSALLGLLQNKIKDHVPAGYTVEWVAQKLLEDDSEITGLMQKQIGRKNWRSIGAMLPDDNRGALAIANARYGWINKILANCVVHEKTDGAIFHRSRFDKVATNPISGGILSIFITLVGFILAASLGFGTLAILQPVIGFIQFVQTSFGDKLPILTALITQGIIPGICMILSVSSFIFGVLLFLGLLEDIGYLPRMAYIADIFMSRIGLHGKSFMPLFIGFGCNIGAVMGCRVIESTRQRFKTIIIASHVPCPGVMVTIAFMIGIFFGPIAPLIVVAVTVALLLQTYITSRLLDHTVLQGAKTGMIMELPPYHMPNWRTIWNYVWLHYKSFLQKAGSLIAVIIILVWALSYFPNGNMYDSYLASAGKALEPIGMLMGMDWKLLTCLFVAFFSKEAALVAMAVIYGIQITDGSLLGLMMDNFSNGPQVSNDELGHFLFGAISQPSALAFIFAILFSIPCFSTVGAIFYETKSLKWTIGSVVYYTSLSFIWGIIAYRIGLLLFQ